MAIYRVNSKSPPIAEGQWVCPESAILDQGCAQPRMVTKVSDERVYWQHDKRGDVETGYNATKTIVFVADTQQEADQVYELEKARRVEIRATKERINTDFDAKVGAILTKEAK